jgi:formate hydrogenlyase transcriptional activator
LQEREFERLGSNQTKRADVRLVTATNRDLEQMMEDREFRSDLSN